LLALFHTPWEDLVDLADDMDTYGDGEEDVADDR